MTRVIAAVALLVCGAGYAIAQTMMSGAEIEAAFRGATFALTTQDGHTATIAFHQDMTALVTLSDGATDPGTYRFADGGYCSTWEGFRAGEEACFKVEKISDDEFQLYKSTGEKDDKFVRQ